MDCTRWSKSTFACELEGKPGCATFDSRHPAVSTPAAPMPILAERADAQWRHLLFQLRHSGEHVGPPVRRDTEGARDSVRPCCWLGTLACPSTFGMRSGSRKLEKANSNFFQKSFSPPLKRCRRACTHRSEHDQTHLTFLLPP